MQEHHRQDAGALIAQGAYGCIYRPALPCAKSGNKAPVKSSKGSKGSKGANVSKVFKSNDYREIEWKMSERIRAIDPKQKYFIYATEQCDVTNAIIKAQPSEGRKETCELIHSPLGAARAKHPMVMLPNGGIPFDAWVAERKDRIGLRDIVRILLPCLDGIRLLVRKGLIHQDLKANNIVVDARGVAKIIDFSLMTLAATSMDRAENPWAMTPYWLLPPEYHMRRWIHDSHVSRPLSAKPLFITDFELEQFTLQELDTIDIRFKSKSDVERLKNIYLYYWSSHCERESQLRALAERMAKGGIAQYVGRVDVYSMGLIMIWASQYTFGFHDMVTLLLNPANETRAPEIFAFAALVRAMTAPNPAKRATIDTVIKMARAFVSDYKDGVSVMPRAHPLEQSLRAYPISFSKAPAPPPSGKRKPKSRIFAAKI
jgi:serine/threonine protein kinase